MDYSSCPDVKRILNEVIADISKEIGSYCYAPEKDFTRNRKLDAEEFIRLSISMEGNSLPKEIYNNYSDKKERMTVSAFVQRKAKVSPLLFREVLRRFNNTIKNPSKLNGYRVFAIDGCNFPTPYNPKSKWYLEASGYNKHGDETKGSCQMHSNMLYDIINNCYYDCTFERDERRAAIELIENIKYQKSIVIMDRGYLSFNMIEHGNRSGLFYIIRSPLVNAIKDIRDLPDAEIDREISITVCTKSNQFCIANGYRKMNVSKGRKEKYSDKTAYTNWDFEDTCEIKFRVVKFRINDDGKDAWEVLVTNLDRTQFPIMEIKKLYGMRWGIETSFRSLKYAVSAINFHSKKDNYIEQELYARLIMFNAVSRAAGSLPVKKESTKHAYKIDFKMAVQIFRRYYRKFCKDPPLKMYADIDTYRQPIREGRQDKRKIRVKSAVYFLYRVA